MMPTATCDDADLIRNLIRKGETESSRLKGRDALLTRLEELLRQDCHEREEIYRGPLAKKEALSEKKEALAEKDSEIEELKKELNAVERLLELERGKVRG